MKNLLFAFFAIALFSCSSSGSAENASGELTPEQEAAMVDSVTNTLDKAKAELNQTTEEKVNEIDSLLDQL